MKNRYATALLGFLILFGFQVSAQEPQTSFTCGVSDQLPRLMSEQRARKAAGERITCRVAVEIDSEWNISTLPPGSYVLRVTTTDGKQAHYRISKQ